MRRADRLFQIVQFLRARRLTTANWLAERLEVSARTIYRDINDLMLSGVPIEGEAGVGYVLRHKMDIPPLMFTPEELRAINIGLRFAHAYTDKEHGDAAVSAMAKIKTALKGSNAEQHRFDTVFVPLKSQSRTPLLIQIFNAIDASLKIEMNYLDAKENVSIRTIRPLGLFFWGTGWCLLSWCELRDDFRSFRVDRIQKMKVLDERFKQELGKTMNDYHEKLASEYGVSSQEIHPDLF